MKIGPNPTQETITKFFSKHPEYVHEIEVKFRNVPHWSETEENYWQSEELTKKAFYMYYGINGYPLKKIAEIAQELRISPKSIPSKIERVITFLQSNT